MMVTIRNAQNINIPAYLNADFFRETLEEGLHEIRITLHEISFEWGSNIGDNYCSSIYRVLVTFERLTGGNVASAKEQRSLIVKTIPITADTQFLEDVGVFLKEKQTYTDVLPRLDVLSHGHRFGASYYHAVKAPVQTIVFEDLKVEGFTVASRENGLNWEHTVTILQQLAKLHATSMVLAKKDPTIVTRFSKGMLCAETVIKSDTFKQMFGGLLKHLIGVVRTWPGYERIAEHLQRYSDNFKAITASLAAPKPDDKYVVLNHGDMWTNNFMYAYDDPTAPKHPTRAIFVDFQLSFFGSPGCDLNFFLNSSVHLDLLRFRRDELIETYYESFAETLDYLRYEHIPSYEDLRDELRSRELYGLFALFGFRPLVTMPKDLSNDNSIETMTNEDLKNKKFQAVLAREELQSYLKFSLKRLDDLGVFAEF